MFDDRFEEVKPTLAADNRLPKLALTPLDVKRYDYLFKLIIIGDQSVGKTNLTMKFCDFGFNSHYVATIGIDFKVKTIEVAGKRVKLQIWDTAGQERFQSISKMYYRGAQGVVFMFDLTNRTSFDNVRRWISSYEDACEDTLSNSDIPKVLVGNKCDDHQARTISTEVAESAANCFCIKYFETSARMGYNVDAVFHYIAEEILLRMEKERQQVKLPKTVQSKMKKRKHQTGFKRGWSWPACNLL